MGFILVYQSLKELFPQVDARILKAVAIEHSKDPDGAVKSIYSDVLPFISKLSDILSTTGKDANAYDNLNREVKITSLCVSKPLDDALSSSFYDAKDTDDHLCTKNKNETEIFLGQCQEVGAEVDEGKKSDASSVSSTGKCSEDNFYRPFRNHMSEAVALRQFQDIRVDKIGNTSSFPIVDDHEADVNLSDQIEHLDHINGHSSYRNVEECRVSSEEASVSIEVGEDNVVLSTIVTGSGQICEINLLQDIVEDAKNYKATLLSAMENVITMMKEVEHKEKEAQDVKEAAAKGGSELLEKMGELKEMLKHAKEANDMHAGEVYGEKSILATEARELQARVLGLSDEKDRSISILEQMRETLEARLAVAEKEKSAAEKELLQKEENARAALAEQELIMEKVVQESKMLQQEAEENAKLHEFLMEKGRFLDVLQGEISVIYQDVQLLKENFDNRVSFSNSLSLKRTDSRQRSSNSSVKSLVNDVAPGLTGPPESPSRISQATSVNCQTPRSAIDERSVEAAVRKELLDDDWEVFDF